LTALRRRQRCTLVSTFACENRPIRGQVGSLAKKNEVAANKALLALLDIQGKPRHLGAMGCQKSIVRLIIERGADFVVALKANHKTLHRQAIMRFRRLKSVVPRGWNDRFLLESWVSWCNGSARGKRFGPFGINAAQKYYMRCGIRILWLIATACSAANNTDDVQVATTGRCDGSVDIYGGSRARREHAKLTYECTVQPLPSTDLFRCTCVKKQFEGEQLIYGDNYDICGIEFSHMDLDAASYPTGFDANDCFELCGIVID